MQKSQSGYMTSFIFSLVLVMRGHTRSGRRKVAMITGAVIKMRERVGGSCMFVQRGKYL